MLNIVKRLKIKQIVLFGFKGTYEPTPKKFIPAV